MAVTKRGPGRPRTGRGIGGAKSEVSMTQGERGLLERAAALEGLSLTGFLRDSGLRRARQIVGAGAEVLPPDVVEALS